MVCKPKENGDSGCRIHENKFENETSVIVQSVCPVCGHADEVTTAKPPKSDDAKD